MPVSLLVEFFLTTNDGAIISANEMDLPSFSATNIVRLEDEHG